MLRFTAIPVLLVACLAVPGRAAPPEKEPDQDQMNYLTKTFLVAMRNHHGDKNANALRKFIDPQYLKQHNLTDRDLAMTMAPVRNISDYKIAADNRTVLCFVDTNGDPQAPVKELILLRLTVHEGAIYISPPKAPDAKTGSFEPWLLRTKN